MYVWRVDHIGLWFFFLVVLLYYLYIFFWGTKRTTGVLRWDWHYSWIFDKFSSANLLTAIFYSQLLVLSKKKKKIYLGGYLIRSAYKWQITMKSCEIYKNLNRAHNMIRFIWHIVNYYQSHKYKILYTYTHHLAIGWYLVKLKIDTLTHPQNQCLFWQTKSSYLCYYMAFSFEIRHLNCRQNINKYNIRS